MMDPKEKSALDRQPIVIANIESSYDRRPDIWHDITESQWNSFQWQWNHRVLTLDELKKVIPLSNEETEAVTRISKCFPIAISPHYAALIRQELGENCPIRMQCIPNLLELESHKDLMNDPLGEYRHAVSQCATRRYPDRALIYSTHECAMRCRHCTRRSRVGLMENIQKSALEEAIQKVIQDERVRDVLISGGDPLSLGNYTIEWIFKTLRQCSHIDVIRLCTRMPCTLPQRIFDKDLLRILKENAPVYLNTQFNHPFEATKESQTALQMLRENGCIIGNQSVLLRGINDRGEILEPLYRWLLKSGCRPYYLFLCDVAQGTHHFRTSIDTGLGVMKHLRGRLSGLGIPHFVIDLPDGYGKVDLCPQNPVHSDGSILTFKNWFDAEVQYHDVLP